MLFARAVVDGPDGVVVKGTKTNRPYRVTIDPDTIAVLGEHRRHVEDRARLCGVALSAESFVFTYAPDAAFRGRSGSVEAGDRDTTVAIFHRDAKPATLNRSSTKKLGNGATDRLARDSKTNADRRPRG